MPSFAAVQAWAPPDRRARVIAAVNVLNAAYMVRAAAIVAGCRRPASACARIFAALGVLSIAVVALSCAPGAPRCMREPAARSSLFFSARSEAAWRIFQAAGERVVIAPNHVSLLDGPLLHTVLPKQAGFAVNNQIARLGG